MAKKTFIGLKKNMKVMNLAKTFTLGTMLGLFPAANAQIFQKPVTRITIQYDKNGKHPKVIYEQQDKFERTVSNVNEKQKNKTNSSVKKVKSKSQGVFVHTIQETRNKFREISEKTVSKTSDALQENFENDIPDTGTIDSKILNKAPDPSITIAGENKKAVIVVDISTNVLYKYDQNGQPEIAYRIASGRKSMPTEKGVRIVTHKEKYPYRGAPRRSKRRRNPKAYGPYIICLNKIDPKSGEQDLTGQFIHGTNEPNTPKYGKYASHGCMRMNNDVITKLKDEVNCGDIVIIK